MKCDAYPGLEVTLQVDGVDLQEYDDPEQEENDHDERGAATRSTVVKYVEVPSGAAFSIATRFKQTFQYHDTALHQSLRFDGVDLPRCGFLEPSSHAHRNHTVSTTIMWENGEWSKRSFHFAHLQTNEEHADISLKEQLSQLGEVSVAFVRCKVTRTKIPQSLHTKGHTKGKKKKKAQPPARRNALRNDVYQAAVQGEVPEKALKGRAISNHVKLGDPVRVSFASPGARTHTTDLSYPWGKKSFVKFTFKYRSRHDLQAKGIIPADVPLEERDPNTLTVDEMRELIERQRVQLQDSTKVKKEKRDHPVFLDELANDDEGIEMLGAGSTCKRKKSFPASEVEVVDLSAH